jgi:hypothetical protein
MLDEEPLPEEAFMEAGIEAGKTRRAKSFGGWPANISALRVIHRA